MGYLSGFILLFDTQLPAALFLFLRFVKRTRTYYV
jgi:hypothetical protein